MAEALFVGLVFGMLIYIAMIVSHILDDVQELLKSKEGSMSPEEALAKAREMWGNNARISYKVYISAEPDACRYDFWLWDHKGSLVGSSWESWEEAFKDAALRAV